MKQLIGIRRVKQRWEGWSFVCGTGFYEEPAFLKQSCDVEVSSIINPD